MPLRFYLAVSVFSGLLPACAAAQADSEERAFLKTHRNNPMPRVAFAADGKSFASGGPDGKVTVWDAGTLQELKTLPHSAAIRRLVYSPKANVLAVATAGKKTGSTKIVPLVVLWDVAKADKLQTLEEVGGALAYSPDGDVLATGSGSLGVGIVLWDAKTGKELVEFKEHKTKILDLTFSPDGKFLASSGADGAVVLWDVSGRKELAKWQAFSDHAECVAFAPNGKTLAAGGWPGGAKKPSIRFWDVAERKEAGEFRTVLSPVKCLAYSRDGKKLVAGGTTEELEILDLEKKDWWAYKIGRWHAIMESLALSPDGKTLVTGNSDGTVGVWDMPQEKQKIDWEVLGELLEKRNRKNEGR